MHGQGIHVHVYAIILPRQRSPGHQALALHIHVCWIQPSSQWNGIEVVDHYYSRGQKPDTWSVYGTERTAITESQTSWYDWNA